MIEVDSNEAGYSEANSDQNPAPGSPGVTEGHATPRENRRKYEGEEKRRDQQRPQQHFLALYADTHSKRQKERKGKMLSYSDGQDIITAESTKQ